MHDARNDAGPSGLMTRAESGAVVTVKVFVEVQVVAPVRISLELLGAAVDRSTAVGITQKDARKALRQFPCDFVQSHAPSGAGRTFDREVVAVVRVVLQ